MERKATVWYYRLHWKDRALGRIEDVMITADSRRELIEKLEELVTNAVDAIRNLERADD